MAKKIFKKALERRQAVRSQAAGRRLPFKPRVVKTVGKERREGIGSGGMMREQAAILQQKIFNLLKEWKGGPEIKQALGIGNTTLRDHIDKIRAKFEREKLPAFIPPKGVRTWSYKKAKRIASFIKFSKDVISGEKVDRVKPRQASGAKVPPEKIREIDTRLAANPTRPDIGIASALSVDVVTIRKRRRRLVERWIISEVSRGERGKQGRRDPKRVTNVLSSDERKQILRKNSKKIKDKAADLYKGNKEAFKSLKKGPKIIEKDVRERLDWALQTFDPKNWPGPEKNKLNAFFNIRLAQILYDIKKVALKAAARPKPEKKKAAKAKRVTVKQLERESRQLDLNPVQEAVFFGLEAKLTEKRIGDAIGLSEGMISIIKSKIEEKKRSVSKKQE